MTPKDKRFESEKLRNAPRVLDDWCVSCQCYKTPGTVVLAHLPIKGIAEAGTALKCSDFWGAHLCDKCHYEADHGAFRSDIMWRIRMVYRTLQRVFHERIVE